MVNYLSSSGDPHSERIDIAEGVTRAELAECVLNIALECGKAGASFNLVVKDDIDGTFEVIE